MTNWLTGKACRAQDIEDAIYDLKAVNPNKQAEEEGKRSWIQRADCQDKHISEGCDH